MWVVRAPHTCGEELASIGALLAVRGFSTLTKLVTLI
jgi:hypothetical protein